MKTLKIIVLGFIALVIISSIVTQVRDRFFPVKDPITEGLKQDLADYEKVLKDSEGAGFIQIKASDFGTSWMLTVSGGELQCNADGAITFYVNGITYAVNGTAKAKGYSDISPIWIADKPPIPKKSLSPLIDKGKTLCK